MEWAERARLLGQALDDHEGRVSDYYDETLHEVAPRVAEAGSLGKADIGALLLWKRLRADARWAAELVRLPDRQVHEHTSAAVRAARSGSDVVEAARRGRAILSRLPGFVRGDALASAVLVAAEPARLPIYDRSAHAAPHRLGLTLTHGPGRYARYVELIEHGRADLRQHGRDWSTHQLDLALFEVGRQR